MPPQQPSHSPLAARRLPWPFLAVLVLGLALLAAYANSFRAPFIFDDESSITENLTLRNWRTVFLPPGNSGLTVSGRPVLNASFALNHALGGENVIGYHAVNLFIHFLAALALFGLVRRTLLLPSLREKFAAASGPLALTVSALWALHPLQTESVTYLVQRAESLAGLFYLFTLYCFVRSIDSPARAGRWLIATVLSCLAGMGAKEVMASAPLVVFLFDRTFVSGSFAAAWKARKRFYLCLAATWLLLVACIISTGNRGGTAGFGSQVSSWSYLLTQSRAIVHYLRLTLWPHPLVLDYGTGLAGGFGEVAGYFLLLLALAAATAFALWKRPAPGFFGTVFFAVLAPTSSIVPVVTQTMAEHRIYLALAPVVIFAVTSLYLVAGTRILLGCALVAVALGIATARRNHDYQDPLSLWRKTMADAPRNVRAINNVGTIFLRRHDYVQARVYFERAVEIDPADANTWSNLASLSVESGRIDEGLDLYRRALALGPNQSDIHYNYGKALLEDGHVDDAIAELEAALAIKPSYGSARYNLANAFVAAGRLDDAVAAYQRVLADDPQSLDACNNLAITLVKLGRATEALPLLESAVKRAPDSAATRLNLGRALMALGRETDGTAAFVEAIRLDPSLPGAHANLANSLLHLGRAAEAIPEFEAALAHGLQDAALFQNLGDAFAAVGRSDDAIQNYTRAVTKDPALIDARYALANALLRSDRPGEAIPHYEALLELRRDIPDTYNNLGIAYAQTGQLDKARACWENALRLRPDFAAARENLDRAQEP